MGLHSSRARSTASSNKSWSYSNHRGGRGSGEVSVQQVTQLIRESASIDQLHSVCTRFEHQLDVAHLDAAFSALAYLARGQRHILQLDPASTLPKPRTRLWLQPQWFAYEFSYRNSPQSTTPTPSGEAGVEPAALAQWLLHRLSLSTNNLRTRDCASVLGSLARMLMRPDPASAELLTQRMLEQLPRASVRDRVQLLHACAKLQLELQPGQVSELLDSLSADLPGGRPQDVSMCLWALATMAHQPPGPWLRHIADTTSGLMRHASAQMLSNSTWALAKLAFRPSAVWVSELLDASQPLLPACTNQELCNLLWGLATMRSTPDRAWLRAALRELHTRAPGLNPQDLANVVWALAGLRTRPGVHLLQALLSRALRLRRQLNPQNTLLTLSGLAELHVCMPERAVAALLEDGGSRQLSAFAPRDLAAVTYVIAICGYRPSDRWLVRFLSHVRARLGAFSGHQLSSLLHGLSRARLRPEPRWLDAVLSEVARCSREGGLSAGELALVLWSIAKLEHVAPEGLLDEVVASVSARAPVARAHEVVAAVRAVNALGRRPEPGDLERLAGAVAAAGADELPHEQLYALLRCAALVRGGAVYASREDEALAEVWATKSLMMLGGAGARGGAGGRV